jgi:hypothetical protein
MRNITLSVPGDCTVPHFYFESEPAQVALALRLGADAVAYIQKRAVDAVRQETHAEAIRQATEDFEEERKKSESSAAAAITKLRQEKLRADEELRAANARVEALENSAGSQRSQIQKDTRASVQELLVAKDQQIAQLQATLERTMEAMGKRVESLQNSMTKTFSSSKDKGTLGELVVEGFLKKAFDCDIQVVSKESQTADIRMTRQGGSYFWEVKNYTRMVTTEEVNKFRRDLRLHPDVRGGILVSLRQGIVGCSRGGDIEVEFLEDGRFILFISHFMSHDDPVFYLQTLRPFFDTIESMSKPVKEEAEAVRSLEMKAALMTNLLRSHAQTISRHKNSIVGHRKRMDTMFSEFQGYVLEAEAQLQTMLRVAMGGDDSTAEVQSEADTALPATIFKKGCLAEYADDRSREFIKWLLATTEVDGSSQVEIKDIIERGKGTYPEKYVRGLREEIFQDAAWPKGSRFLVGLRLLKPVAA